MPLENKQRLPQVTSLFEIKHLPTHDSSLATLGQVSNYLYITFTCFIMTLIFI
jgi:hypothetical protein